MAVFDVARRSDAVAAADACRTALAARWPYARAVVESLEPLDRAILQSERRRWPMLMHLELLVDGAVDPELLTTRLAALCARTPRLAARLEVGSWSTPATWIPAARPTVRRWSVKPDDLDRARSRWISVPIDLRRSAGLEVSVLDDDTGHTRVMMRAHHGVLDGQSLAWVARSLADGHPQRDDSPVAQPRSEAATATGGLGALRRVAFPGRPDRLVSERGPAGDAQGYGITNATIDAADAASLDDAAARLGVRVNDVLVAGVHLACAAWNDRLGHESGVVRVTVPFSLRRDDTFAIGNAASQVATVSTGAVRSDPDGLVRSVAEQIATARRRAEPDPIPWVPALSRLPLTVGSLATRVGSALSGHAFLDTTRLSNLGRLPPLEIDRAPVVGAWFSPPTRLPQGAAIGVVRYGASIGMSVRWCAESWDGASASSLAALSIDRVGDLT
ncbi:MAG: hypothetical protein ACE367_06565 [Acidimicrobiales bacterium]